METGISKTPAPGAPGTPSTSNINSESRSPTNSKGGAAQVREQKHRDQDARRSNQNAAAGRETRRGRGGHQGKKRNMGRTEWAKNKVDKRQRNEDEQAAKRQRVDQGKDELPIYATKFSDEVLAAEERRPKKKVAVLLGYAGTGYKGMQLTHDQKTIEGDLFQAFVAAGAISKANADDPKKSSFVRCARTDKGVHAAGNVISLKLIIEDEDIVQKINDNLTPQIRVWGYERTNNSFSAYQMVDSRIYEYLIPTHSFLPPHPSSFLGRNSEKWAEKKDDLEWYRKRQEEVLGYWEKVDEEMIKPILAEYDQEIRAILEKALWPKAQVPKNREDGDMQPSSSTAVEKEVEHQTSEPGPPQEVEIKDGDSQDQDLANNNGKPISTGGDSTEQPKPSRSRVLDEAMKRIRQAYIAAKRAYRIPTERLDRIQEALNLFVGTRNYHNYTIEKTFKDPSAKRVIKSFLVNRKPIIINGTEWLSMKVHGQSFMMHQIRKMVGMVALVVRCGCDPKRLIDSMGPERLSIPKAPSLGLLLERPVFESYNKRAKDALGKEIIDFDKYKDAMDKFKQEQIYERMYRDEGKENVFGNFFNHVDNFPTETFLFVTSGGIEATKTKAPVEGVGAVEEGGKKIENALLLDNDVDIGVVDEDSDADDAVRDNHGDEG
ncbi:tRNA pseudouridine38-40 synthase [Cladophialophora psammophila CBS 110553]|uniref:tRNA pseudouridine synthase 1 n=1 Tax=Cladophialophora psammophila CBS 110553 TaxID=1182543 RepID=W9WXD6_9EURO|nr:tRNA pseudouridine38-40 synthase [Cladophialophora psammophila CBS 110553]EXJ72842.1 tRNA pseudouridine38-40 synthase [Cladophialophora psammophila CBS 110553]